MGWGSDPSGPAISEMTAPPREVTRNAARISRGEPPVVAARARVSNICSRNAGGGGGGGGAVSMMRHDSLCGAHFAPAGWPWYGRITD